ncbi:hypothetical protein AAC387_Pa09g1085 [Persea americana]
MDTPFAKPTKERALELTAFILLESFSSLSPNSDHKAAWYRFNMEPQFASILKHSKVQTGKDLPAYSKWAPQVPSSFKTPPFSLSEVQGTRKKIGGKKRKGEVKNVDVFTTGS